MVWASQEVWLGALFWWNSTSLLNFPCRFSLKSLSQFENYICIISLWCVLFFLEVISWDDSLDILEYWNENFLVDSTTLNWRRGGKMVYFHSLFRAFIFNWTSTVTYKWRNFSVFGFLFWSMVTIFRESIFYSYFFYI